MERKKNYVAQVINMTESYKKVMITEAANVGSQQMQDIRKLLRGKAVLLMGKNTMIKKAVLTHKDKNPKLAALLPHLKGNIGLVFTNGDLKEVRDLIDSNKTAAAAKAGQISNKTIIIPSQNTGMEPTKTSFFQALNIPTKISKGTVEIVSDFKILDIGQKVTQSEAALLALLNMKPFSYGLVAKTIYDDGTIYSPDVLDTSSEDMMKVLTSAITNIGAVSLEAHYPTAISVASSIITGLKNVLSVSVGTTYEIAQTKGIKEYLKDPSKFAVTAAPKEEKKTEKKEEKKVEKAKEPEPEEEGDGDMGLGLFGGDD